MDNFLWLTQFMVALLGIIVSAIWYLTEKRRVRYISLLWGMWCALLASYRVYRWTIVAVSHDQALFLNSLVNWLLLMGAINVCLITIDHIVGVHRRGKLN